MGKTRKGERLADLKNLLAVHLVPQEGIARSIRRGSICRCQRLPVLMRLRTLGKNGRRLTSAGMSSSKCRVSAGLRSSGRYGAG